MSRTVRIVQVMRSDRNDSVLAINGDIRSITFEFDADGQIVSKTAEPVRPGKSITYIPWDWRNAQSLLSTGDWKIVADRDTTADIPKTESDELEGGAW